jgi:hypothetical protein
VAGFVQRDGWHELVYMTLARHRGEGRSARRCGPRRSHHGVGHVQHDASDHTPRTTYFDAVLLATVAGARGAPPDIMMWLDSLPENIDPEPAETRSFSLEPFITHARSQGWVRLRSDNPTDPPVINYGFFTDPEGMTSRRS